MTSDEENQLAGEQNRGARASRIIDDPMVREAFSAIEAELMRRWRTSPIRDAEGQRLLRLEMDCFDKFRKYFEDAVTTGKMASTTLEQERTLRERAKSAVRAFRR